MRIENWKSVLRRSGSVLGLAALSGVPGCRSAPANNLPAPIIDAASAPDPAAVNNAPVSGKASGTYRRAVSSPVSQGQAARVLGQEAYAPQAASTGEQYPEQTKTSYPGQSYPQQNYPQQNYPAQNYPPQAQGAPYPGGGEGTDAGYDEAYEQQVDSGQDALYADQPPPPLPVYQQPELTDPGDLWTPGYWSYAPQGYFWVPGAWVAPPFAGALWTPGYWGAYGGRYRFHHGFWGRHIGFYGGVPYGFGYTGVGYEGGYWNGDRFFYNDAVNRVDRNAVRDVYARDVRQANGRVSYNGPGGWNARPTASDMAALRDRRMPAIPAQRQRAQDAASNRQQFAGQNGGRPPVTVLTQQHGAPDRTLPAPAQPAPFRPGQRPPQNAGQAGSGAPQGGRQAGFGPGATPPVPSQPANTRQGETQYGQPQQNQYRQQGGFQRGNGNVNGSGNVDQRNGQVPRPLPSPPANGTGGRTIQDRQGQPVNPQGQSWQRDGVRQVPDRPGPTQLPARVQPVARPGQPQPQMQPPPPVRSQEMGRGTDVPQRAPSRPQPMPQMVAPQPAPHPAPRPQEARPAESSHPGENHPHR